MSAIVRPARRYAAALAAAVLLVSGGAGAAGAATARPIEPAADTLAAEPGPPAARATGADRADRAARAAGGVGLVGNGYGHGHGMSQNGAQAQAKAGRSHRQILSFYYPGLATRKVGGAVKVLISADTTGDVVVSKRSGLKVVSPGHGPRPLARKGASRWRLTSAAGGRSTAVSYYQGRRWHSWRTLRGQAQFTAGGAPITLHLPGGSTRAYRGALRSAAPSAGAPRDTVNVVPLDTYLRGVVPREVPALWAPQAVQAQAVAARTYAAYERRASPKGRHYQTCDTTACQVYGGATDEHPASDRAVRATRGQVLTAGGKPAFTQFSASNGGRTSDGGFPYLPAKEDPYDTVYRGWTDTVTYAEMERAFPALGAVRGIAVTRRDGHGQWGGRALAVEIRGSSATTTVSGETFRSYFGLNSSWFTQR